jgi:hypothetical protein
LQDNIWQRQSRDALLVVAAARDSKPSTEGHIGCPAPGKDASGISELAFESQQCIEVTLAAISLCCSGD